MIFTSPGPKLEAGLIPDDLSIPQFFLDSQHPARPTRGLGRPWLIDDYTGREYGFEEVRSRTFGLANTMAGKYGIGQDDVVCIFSPNQLDYPIAIWATHRVGGIVSCANPSYTASELVHQLTTAKPSLLITSPPSLSVAIDAAKQASLPLDRIVVFVPPTEAFHPDSALANVKNNGATSTAVSYEFASHLGTFLSIDQLIHLGNHDLAVSGRPNFVEKRLAPGEGKTKLAFLSFSSGTTGKPKAVAIPHVSVIANVVQTAVYTRMNDPTLPFAKRRFRDGDVSIGVLPLFHIYGLVVVLHCNIFAGIPLVITPKFNFLGMLESIVRYRITHLWLVPPHMVLLTKQPETKKYDLSHVRFTMVGAAPVSRELQTAYANMFPNAAIGQAYGMTETSTTLTMWPLEPKNGIPGSAGRLIPGTEAKVIKEDGTLAGYGEPGELVVRGPQMAIGYSNNAQATKETFRDGWVHTGDEVIFREGGDLFIVDRLKEILKVRGFQVAPAELEGHLLTHEYVNDAGVVGVQNEYSGDLPKAFIVLVPSIAAEVAKSNKERVRVAKVISKHVADHKTKYKWLEGGVEFVDAIPKNPSGKILRRVLRERAHASAAKVQARARL